MPWQYLIGDRTLGETLTDVAELAKEALAADMAGITMLVGGQPATAVFTDREAPEIDEAPYHGGSGPCVEALRSNRVVKIPCVLEDRRWPEFATVAERYGIRSTMSLP